MESQKNVRFASIFFYVFSAVAFGLGVYYFKEIRTNLLLFKRLDIPWIIFALAAQAGTYLFNTLIYYDFLGMYGLAKRFKIRTLLQANVVLLFFNQSVPSVGLSGNAFYFSFLIKRGVSRSQAYSLILVELLSFYTAILLVFGFFLIMFVTVLHPKLYMYIILYWGIILYTFLAVLMGILGKEEVVDKIFRFFHKVTFLKKLRDKLSNRVHSTKEHFGDFENPWKLFFANQKYSFAAVLFQWIVFCLDALTIYALFRGLHIDASYLMIFICFMLTKVVAALPISPGELLVYESSLTVLLITAGLPFGAAAIVTLLYRVLSFWTPIPLGLLLYRHLYISEEM